MDTPTTLGLEQQSQPPAPSPPPPKKIGFIIMGWLGIAAGLAVTLLHAWGLSYGIVDASFWGRAVGGAVLPVLIAYLIAGRKSVRNFSSFGLWFCGVSIFCWAVTNEHPVSLQQHIGDIMKEASGTKPVENNGSSMDALVRDSMRDILDERKTHDRDMERYTPDLRKIYSLESFSSKEAMQRSVDAVRGIVTVDQTFSQQIERIPDQIQTRADHSGLSSSERADFMAGVRKGYGDAKLLALRRQAVGVEKDWGDQTVAFYEFAMENSTKIRVQGSHLLIANEQIRAEFNNRRKKSLALRESLQTLNKELESGQQEAMKQMGMTMADLGLEDKSHPPNK
jgi:hypothetical protein